MSYIIASLFGMLGGAIAVYFALEAKRKRLDAQRAEQVARAKTIQAAQDQIRPKTEELHRVAAALDKKQAEFDARVIKYEELREENLILKRDLLNVAVNTRKQLMDHDTLRKNQEDINEKVQELGTRYLDDNFKWITSSLKQDNFIKCKDRLQRVVDGCKSIGLKVPKKDEERLFEELGEEYRRVVRVAMERERQAQLKARIREEQLREREIERELEKNKREHENAERDRAALQSEYENALTKARDEHSTEVEALRAKLEEAQAHLAAIEETERAISQAQLTRAGHVYVISNIGSLGEGVFKIGMTRRLEPLERIKELGDASVPFPFDVHMMISSDDAPKLESILHKSLHKLRVNKMNPRKEFFRAQIEEIYGLIKENHGEVEYVADVEALEYRQSTNMTDEDGEFIENAYNEAEDDGESPEPSI